MMNPATSLSSVALVGLLSCTSGCSSTNPPNVSVRSATFSEHTSDGMVLTFEVEAENPNPDPLPLEDVRYEVFLDGKRVFTGTRSAQATVRRFGNQSINLPAAIPITGDQPPLMGAKEYELRGRITYLKPGALAKTLFDIEVLRPSAGFSAAGSVDLSKLEPVKDEPARPLPERIVPGES